MSNAPAGWYPVDETSQRYWDGAAWTEHVAPVGGTPGADAHQPPAPQPQPPGQQPQPPGQQPQPPAPQPEPPGQQPQAPSQPSTPTGLPGAGFPAGIGEPHQPVADPVQQTWGAAPAGIPYTGHAPAPFNANAALASTADDRSMAVLCHVLGIFTGFVGPLIIWLIKKDTSPFVDAHGKTALNFQISLLIYWLVVFITIFLIIGIFLVPILILLGIILPIIAAVAANKGETYSYPLAIPFFS